MALIIVITKYPYLAVWNFAVNSNENVNVIGKHELHLEFIC